jgi:hypothetical protein
VKPSSHAALYNWGVALSDLARCIKATQPREATAALHLASQKYAQSLQLHPRNPQALNNWGLVLQVGCGLGGKGWLDLSKLLCLGVARNTSAQHASATIVNNDIQQLQHCRPAPGLLELCEMHWMEHTTLCSAYFPKPSHEVCCMS